MVVLHARGAAQLGVEQVALLLGHARAVVLHTEDEHVALPPRLHQDVARAALLLDAVVDGVLHQRLQDQLVHPQRKQLLRHVDFVVQLVLVAHLLDVEVAAHVIHLVREGDDLPAPAQADAEQAGQRAHQPHDLVGLVLLRHPADGIQGVVEEVGLDLGLQGADLGLTLLLLLPVHQVQQVANVVHHAVEAAAQLVNLAGVALRIELHVQIAPLGLAHQPPELADRAGEGGREAQRHGRGQQNRHHRHHDGVPAQRQHRLQGLAHAEHAHGAPAGDLGVGQQQLVALAADGVDARCGADPLRADAVHRLVHRGVDDLAAAILHEHVAALAQRDVPDALLDHVRAHVRADHAQQHAAVRIVHRAHHGYDVVGGIVAVVADVAPDGPGDQHPLTAGLHRAAVPAVLVEGVAGDAVELVGGVQPVLPRDQQPTQQLRIDVHVHAHLHARRGLQGDALWIIEAPQPQIGDHVLVAEQVLHHAVHRAHRGVDVRAHLIQHLRGVLVGLLVDGLGVVVVAEGRHEQKRHRDQQHHGDQQLFLQAQPAHARTPFHGFIIG